MYLLLQGITFGYYLLNVTNTDDKLIYLAAAARQQTSDSEINNRHQRNGGVHPTTSSGNRLTYDEI